MAKKKTTAKATKAASQPAKAAQQADAQDSRMPFSRKNYILLIIGVLIIMFGFFLLSLDGFVDAQKFSVSLYIAPFVIVGGFVEIIFAIMYREKKTA